MSESSVTCETDTDCLESFEKCYNGNCICKPLFYKSSPTSCIKCPDLGQPCNIAQCCSHPAMECNRFLVCECTDPLCGQTPIFITASQIALSAALIMGMAALTMVVYRLCTKPGYLTSRQRPQSERIGDNFDTESATFANYLRASLSSMQIRILSRLRDRPPSYSTRQASVNLPEAPPPYERAIESTSLPPAYTELVLSPTVYINSTCVNITSDSITQRNNTDYINTRSSNINISCNLVSDPSQFINEHINKEPEEGGRKGSNENCT